MKAVQAITRTYVVKFDDPDKVEALLKQNDMRLSDLVSNITFVADGGDFADTMHLIKSVDRAELWWGQSEDLSEHDVSLGKVDWTCGDPTEMMVEE